MLDSLTKMFDKVYPQPKADFTVLPSNNEICIGDTLFFADKSDGKTSAVTQWNWVFGDNTSSTLQNPFRKYTDTGNFTVKLFIYNLQGCVSDTLPKIMTVHPYPKLDLGPDLFVLEGGSVLINPKSYFATNPSFLWTPNTYLNSDTLSVPRSTPKEVPASTSSFFPSAEEISCLCSFAKSFDDLESFTPARDDSVCEMLLSVMYITNVPLGAVVCFASATTF